MSDSPAEDLFSQLNESQAAAVKATEGPVLVLAGAGTGKTRVITYRIAHLIKNCGVLPSNIMAVTFTNKAAEEMKSRITKLVGYRARQVWMGTFHSIGLNMLRRFGSHTVTGSGFGIIDQDDRLRIVREIVKDLKIDSKKYSVKNYLSLISDYKNTIMYVDEIPAEEITHKFPAVFAEYENRLRNQHLVDFDDMLSIPLRLLTRNDDILEYYRDICRYILVDEYQDTNAVQFMFLQALAGKSGNICVVGDDDQAIYGWRGAEVENILSFDLHFKNVREIKLTDNYRSAPEILKIANNIIRNNTARRGKELVASTDRRGDIKVIKTMDELSEAEHVAENISRQLSDGIPASEIAVLYRTNAQSRNFEVVLNRMKIPYRVVGGVGFYQRREVKDILSYLRIYDNPYDEAAYFRAAKTPPKGIGDTLLDKVRQEALKTASDFLTAADRLIPVLTPRQASALGNLQNIMDNLVSLNKISDMINTVIEKTCYRDYLTATEDGAEAKVRMENLEELYNAAMSFEEQGVNAGLSDFLSAATLITSSEQTADDTVSLMSLHGAKGLEFESVYLTGMEDGIFPLSSHNEELEEERRLCYVGVTRAKVSLAISAAESRMTHGKRQGMKPSRFLGEMGVWFKGHGREKPESALISADSSDGYLRKGQPVIHELFGRGVVMQISGVGDNAKVDVMFKNYGMKKLVARFLKPEI